MSTAPHNESCTQAVNSWYNEVKDYNFNAARPFQDNWNQPKQIGHFTALVWKGTTSMGCGRALGAYRFSNGMTGTCKVIVCRCGRGCARVTAGHVTARQTPNACARQ